jgi:hypothetical protein
MRARYKEAGRYCGLIYPARFWGFYMNQQLIDTSIISLLLAECDVISREHENAPFEKYFISPTFYIHEFERNRILYVNP